MATRRAITRTCKRLMLPVPAFDANVVSTAQSALAAQGHVESADRLGARLDQQALERVACGALTVEQADQVRAYATRFYDVELRSLDRLGALQTLSWAMDSDPVALGQGTVPATLRFDDAELDVYLLTEDLRALLS